MKKLVVTALAATVSAVVSPSFADNYYFNPGAVDSETPVDLTDLSVWHKDSKTGAAPASLDTLAASTLRFNALTNTVTVPENTVLKASRVEMDSDQKKSPVRVVCKFPQSSTFLISGNFYGAQSSCLKEFVWQGGTFCAKGKFFHEWSGTAEFSGAGTVVSNTPFALQHYNLRYAFSDGVLLTGCSLSSGNDSASRNNFIVVEGPGTVMTNCTMSLSGAPYNCMYLTNGVRAVNCGDVLIGSGTNTIAVADSEISVSSFKFTSVGGHLQVGPGSTVRRTLDGNTLFFAGGSGNVADILGPSTVFSGWNCRMQGSSQTLNVRDGARYTGANMEVGYSVPHCRLNVSGTNTTFALSGDFKCGTSDNASDDIAEFSDGATATVGALHLSGKSSVGSKIVVRDGAKLTVTNSYQGASGLVYASASGGDNGIVVDNGELVFKRDYLRFLSSAHASGNDYISMAGTNGFLSVQYLNSDGSKVELRFSVPREGKADGRPYVDLWRDNASYSVFNGQPGRFGLKVSADEHWARSGRSNCVDLIRAMKISKNVVSELTAIMSTVDPATLGGMTLSVVEDDTYAYLRLNAGPRQGMVIILR